MSSEGIAYKILLEIATNKQLLFLCEPGLRDLLSTKIANNAQFPEDQKQQILKDAVDLAFACRDETGKKVLLDLIKAKMPDGFVSKLAAFARLDGDNEEVVLRHYQSKPIALEKFLCWPQTSGKADSKPEQTSGIVSPERPLRYYQLMGVREILRKLEENLRCLYQAPTGAGKTRTAMAVVARHFCRHGPTKVLWLASTTELVDQACKAFQQEWQYAGDTDAVMYDWKGGGQKFNPSSATNKNTMLVASVQLLALLPDEISVLQDAVSLIIFDEAHQSLAPTYQNILSRLLKGKGCKLLGLSATPIRTESEDASNELAAMYHHNKIKIHSDGKNPIEFLVSKGYLAKTQFEKFNFKLQNTPKPKPVSNDYSKKLLEWLGKSVERNDAIVKYVKKIIDQGRLRILVFTPTILSARYCALMLKSLHDFGYYYCISGDTNRLLRKRNLAKFASSDPDPVVIFNCQVLTTGFDEPKTDAVMVARPTQSETLYTQMIGRALRGPESDGTKNAYIYNFADQNLEGYNRLIDLFETFEKSWD